MITDRYSRLMKEIPNVRKTATAAATIFPDHYIFNVGIQSTILTNKGLQFTSNFFNAICAKLKIKPLRTAEY